MKQLFNYVSDTEMLELDNTKLKLPSAYNQVHYLSIVTNDIKLALFCCFSCSYKYLNIYISMMLPTTNNI